MQKSVVLIGVGEMGGVFARGLLKSGCAVFPATRQTDLAQMQKSISDPQAVVVAVAEKDFNSCLQTIPKLWLDRLVLLQNELIPQDWQRQHVSNPTVISVWFEKKYPQDYKVIIPSPVFGPKADIIATALKSLNIPTVILKSEEELLVELVVKNLYILTINIAGLKVGGTVEELWKKHQALAQEVANEVLDIQFSLIGKELTRKTLIEKMVTAFAGDWQHKCMGRTARDRLTRALYQADEAGLAVPTLRQISLL